jgi:DNA-binding PadR family transcriptional regulator
VLSLAVPRDCRVELQVVSASLMVGGLRAPVVARSVSGEITLAGLGGTADAQTVSGAVQASGVTGDLSAKTVSGDLTVAEGGGGSVRARTVSGAVAVDLLASGERDINLTSVSGDGPRRPAAPRPGGVMSRRGSGNPGGGAPMNRVFSHGRLRLYLLKLLDESPRHGYDVIRLLEDRFMGLYAPSPGTIYPRLQRLEAEGLVTHSTEGGRKVYRITDAGREELAGRRDDGGWEWDWDGHDGGPSTSGWPSSWTGPPRRCGGSG